MSIYSPGEKFRNYKLLNKKSKGKRDVVAVLSLTAMVDMFTVLVIFLLQNYNTVLYIPPEVNLPKAQETKDLKPAVVVTISNKEVMVDRKSVLTFQQLKDQTEWLVEPLFAQVTEALKVSRIKYEQDLQRKLREVVDNQKDGKKKEDDNFMWNKVTIQADKGIDYLTVKKVLYTVSEAGAGELNFAVTKEPSH